MSSLVPLLSALSLFSFSSNDSAKINNIIYDNKITLLQENSVEKDFNVDNILLNTKSKEKGDNSDFTHSQAFTDIEEHLED